MGWMQATSETEGPKMSSNKSNIASGTPKSNGTLSSAPPEHLLFVREVIGYYTADADGTEYKTLQEGYITVTPLAALSPAEVEGQAYFKEWLQSVSELSSSSAL
ncbi:hypothetical protein RIF29_37648 [Crotalaria pallida]|uniref:Uncharacterized protein n=1 Tax=Crotalaria pallida TaxID=3830 RepID=A0AAN9HV94_CROPI